MPVIVTEENVLPRRVVPQPQPALNTGGDCGICVFAGITGLSLKDVYSRFFPSGAPSRNEMLTALQAARREDLIARVIDDVPIWNLADYYMAFGAGGYLYTLEWFQYIRMAVEAGYYGIASVVFAKTGAEGAIPPPTDHVVLLCGARERFVPHATIEGAGRYDCEVLVSCSAKSSPVEEWVEVKTFLTERGGYNAILVRPVKF